MSTSQSINFLDQYSSITTSIQTGTRTINVRQDGIICTSSSQSGNLGAIYLPSQNRDMILMIRFTAISGYTYDMYPQIGYTDNAQSAHPSLQQTTYPAGVYSVYVPAGKIGAIRTGNSMTVTITEIKGFYI